MTDVPGRFVRARKRKSSTTPITDGDPSSYELIQGRDFKSWLDARYKDDGKPDDFPEELSYRAGTHRNPIPYQFPIDGTVGATGMSEDSFIYLDVGAWIGAKDGKWAKDDPENYRRDFGLICGPHVLLCKFSAASHKGELASPDAGWAKIAATAEKSKNKDLISLVKLLDTLKGVGTMGDAVVVRYIRDRNVRNFGPKRPYSTDDDAHVAIHVIVGDMHVPVLDGSTPHQTWGGVTPYDDPDVKAWNEYVAKAELVDAVTTTFSLNIVPVQAFGDSPDAKKAKDQIPGVVVDPRPLRYQEGKRVKRLGRVDFGPLKKLVTTFVSPTSTKELEDLFPVIDFFMNPDHQGKWTAVKEYMKAEHPIVSGAFKSLPDVVDDQLHPDKAAAAKQRSESLHKIIDFVRHYRDVQDLRGVEHGTMTQAEAEDWYRFYLEGVDGRPPADIFEKSGADFEAFADKLVEYQQKNADARPIHFHQLGDMIDLWIGFSSYYAPSSGTTEPGKVLGNYAPVVIDGQDPKHNYGLEMAKYWVGNCLGNTVQGQAVARACEKLEALAGGRSGRNAPTFLYGNHDNYLGSVSPSYKSPSGNDTRTIIPRSNIYAADGLWMEHGHQWEDENANNSPVIALTKLLIGTDGPIGEFVTQAAFVRPAPIRGFSSKASAFMDTKKKDPWPPQPKYGARLMQVSYATELFIGSGGAFRAYAMGHTHRPCLSRIRVWPGDDFEDIDSRNVLNKRKADFDLKIEKKELQEGETLIVKWSDYEREDDLMSWIAVDDPAAPVGHRRRGLWMPTRHHDNHEMWFYGVPPGRYEGRLYAILETGESPIGRSPVIDVYGISLERPIHDDEPEDNSNEHLEVKYSVSGSTFSPDLIVRWAMFDDPKIHDPDKCFVIVLTHDEYTKLTSPQILHLRETEKRSVSMKEMDATHPAYGRRQLPPNLAAFIASQKHEKEFWLVVMMGVDATSFFKYAFTKIEVKR